MRVLCSHFFLLDTYNLDVHVSVMCERKKKKNQRRAIWHEFESIGPTLLKKPLGAGWGLLLTLQVMCERG
jgi:hypothetical protein